MGKKTDNKGFVDWFRDSAPYINAFRKRTFVIMLGGEAVDADSFYPLVHDLALLNSLGIQLVLVHGIRPQVEKRLQQRGASIHYENGLRITDDAALECVKEAAGTVRLEIEALLSMGVANSPTAGARIRVTSGNVVTAQPLGIRDGVDYMHTGEVRRIDVAAIEKSLKDNAIVLLSPVGYSPTGEVFNLHAEDVATAAAIQIAADKLIILSEDKGLAGRRSSPVRELSIAATEKLLGSKRKLNDDTRRHLNSAVRACRHGVKRAHIIDRHIDGALLTELFTRDGIGTLVTDDMYDNLRTANIDDIVGILELIAPLEQEGSLVKRSREMLEMEIDRFTVMERDGTVIGCAALYPYIEEKVAELACVAIHPDYQKEGKGKTLIQHIVSEAKQLGLKKLFLLTAQTSHWFREQGFKQADLKALPVKRRMLYNYQRNSKVIVREL